MTSDVTATALTEARTASDTRSKPQVVVSATVLAITQAVSCTCGDFAPLDELWDDPAEQEGEHAIGCNKQSNRENSIPPTQEATSRARRPVARRRHPTMGGP
jgi:hypothetical protein